MLCIDLLSFTIYNVISAFRFLVVDNMWFYLFIPDSNDEEEKE